MNLKINASEKAELPQRRNAGAEKWSECEEEHTRGVAVRLAGEEAD